METEEIKEEIETTENIEKIMGKSSIFERLGLSRVESKILSMLVSTNKPQTGRYIEKTMDMRQPEISLGTKSLQARGWIREDLNRGDSKRGRPEKTYELSMKREKIIEEMRQYILGEYKYKQELLQELIIKKVIEIEVTN